MGRRNPSRSGTRRGLLRTLFVSALSVALGVPVCAFALWRLAHTDELTYGPFAPARPESRPETAPDLRSGSFSVLTYNVAGLPSWVSPFSPAENMPHIAERLNGYDLVLVQEDFSHHAALERGAKHRYQSVPQATANRIVNDGLNRFSRFDFVPLTRESWQRCNGILRNSNDCLASKGFSVAETTLAPGVQLHVYNHHADAGRAPADRAARAAEFAQLAEFIEQHSQGQAVLLVGDTNLDPADAADTALLDRFLQRTGLRTACASRSCDAPQLDRVLYRSGDDLSLEPSLWELASEFGTKLPGLSDHRAVHVRMQWRAVEPATTARLSEPSPSAPAGLRRAARVP